MKTAKDPRHVHRTDAIKLLYTYSFSGVVDPMIAPIVEKLEKIDETIASIATEFKLADMNKVDLAILRFGVFELLEGKEKPAIIIDEAIEIAKEYGAENSGKFVNAVLSKATSAL